MPAKEVTLTGMDITPQHSSECFFGIGQLVELF
jgi:hypothetical protein